MLKLPGNRFDRWSGEAACYVFSLFPICCPINESYSSSNKFEWSTHKHGDRDNRYGYQGTQVIHLDTISSQIVISSLSSTDLVDGTDDKAYETQ